MSTPTALPPAAPDVVASAVEALTSRLRKKLDAAVTQYAEAPVTTENGSVTIICGEDTAVTLTPGPSGTITTPDQATCTCLLSPRCLHRAAILTTCPLPTPPPPPEAPTPEIPQDTTAYLPADPEPAAPPTPSGTPLSAPGSPSVILGPARTAGESVPEIPRDAAVCLPADSEPAASSTLSGTALSAPGSPSVVLGPAGTAGESVPGVSRDAAVCLPADPEPAASPTPSGTPLSAPGSPSVALGPARTAGESVLEIPRETAVCLPADSEPAASSTLSGTALSVTGSPSVVLGPAGTAGEPVLGVSRDAAVCLPAELESAAVSMPSGAALSAVGAPGVVLGSGRAGGELVLGGGRVGVAEGVWGVAVGVLVAGVAAVGAVQQAELLRAAHAARVAGLYRVEAAALRVVRGVRGARGRQDGHRLADLVGALRELLLTARLLAAGCADPGVVGVARRAYQAGGGLRVFGVCREPVVSATGYGGVVTHLVTEDGRWFSVADVKPGGVARARGAATAPVALGGVALDHARLARSGLLVVGATVSPDGRLGSGKGVRATPIRGLSWAEGPASLFGRPLAEAAAERLAVDPGADPEHETARAREPVGCDLVIIGPAGDHVLARELRPADDRELCPAGDCELRPASDCELCPAGDRALCPGEEAGEETVQGPLIRLTPAARHPDLGHLANLRQLAARPGLRVRVVARLDPAGAAMLSPLAVGPVPSGGPTLRLPEEWQGHADLGYDRLQGSHFPPDAELRPPPPVPSLSDPLAESPLWRVRRLVELAVSGGRRAVAESVRSGVGTDALLLRRAGFHGAADLATALTTEANRRTRDVFGVLSDPDPSSYATAWLASALHLAATEHALIQSTWQTPTPTP